MFPIFRAAPSLCGGPHCVGEGRGPKAVIFPYTLKLRDPFAGGSHITESYSVEFIRLHHKTTQKTKQMNTYWKTTLSLIGSGLMAASASAGVTARAEDTTTLGNWRTSATLETDNQYGTDGYVLYGIDSPDGTWNTPYDATSLTTADVTGDSQISLPSYIGDISVAAGTAHGRWSGNGNMGQIQDPANANALTSTPVLAWGATAWTATITRPQSNAFRLTVMFADGDGQDALWNSSVNAGTTGSASITGATANGSGNSTYHVYDIGAGTDDITVSWSDNSANANWGVITGFAFDAYVDPPVLNRWVLDADGDWNTAANWSLTAVPNGQEAAATLDDGDITNPVTATLDVAVTLGELNFDSALAYTVAGANTLSFDNAGNGASMAVVQGDHTISAPVTLAEFLTAKVDTGASLELSGTLSDSGGFPNLIKNGAGYLLLSGDISGFTGITTINGGTVVLPHAGDYTLTHEFEGAGRLALTGGGRVTLDPAGFNDHGGTDVSNGGTLVVDSADDLGAGGVGFDDATLEVTADVSAATAGWLAGAGGGTVDVATGFTLEGGAPTGSGPMTKTGDGTWRILPGGRMNTYTGATTVEAGTLILDQAFLDDASSVELTVGATLQLDFAGTDTIDLLFIDGTEQATGTWGALASGADNKTALITGTGLLQATGTGGNSYLGWAAGFPTLTDTDPDVDFEMDGLDTGVEYVLAGDPSTPDSGAIAPTFETDANDFVFVYRRSDLANDDPDTLIDVEYGSDLENWNFAEDGVDEVSITEDDDFFGDGIDRVTVRIPRSLAVGGRLFARLNVEKFVP